MVKLHVKKGDESQFLHESTVETLIDDVIHDVIYIYNGRLKVLRICSELEQLAEHGITLPPNMQGLADEQIDDLKLKDEWADRCQPSGGQRLCKDVIGRRNGAAPTEKMKEMLLKTKREAEEMISKKNAEANKCVTSAIVREAVDILRGATMIVYPMGLPPHDPIRQELENNEDLTGTQSSKDVIEESVATLWWAGKEMIRGKKLADFMGKNEKTKIVCKLQKKGQGVPGREPVISEDEKKSMMAYYYRKQEDFKKLEADAQDSYMDSTWADSNALKKQFQGLGDIKWGGAGK